ncbi:MAG: reverse transcriptase domain-containing protein [Methylococcales bacterium]|nr:reverse transcriptase domain-containing protein [Methylococcales bacterium]
MFEGLLMEIANKAAQDKTYRFHDCLAWLSADCFYACWSSIRKNAIGPVKRFETAEYEKKLQANITGLEQQIQQQSYKPRIGDSRQIPKVDGDARPLGMPSIDDTILQLAVSRILEAIYKYDFLPDCYGFRPGLGAYNPIKALAAELESDKYKMLIEADVKGYIENIEHELLIRMLGRRIADRGFLNLVGKWLKAGLHGTDRKFRPMQVGILQGEYITPILGNIYLHYVLDLWFKDYAQAYCSGQVYFCRYSYDIGCAVQHPADAEHLYHALSSRLERYGLLRGSKLRLWHLEQV